MYTDYRASQRKLGGEVLKFEADLISTVHLFRLIGSGTNCEFCIVKYARSLCLGDYILQGFIQDFFVGGERLCAGKLISCGHRPQPPRGVWGHALPEKF